uniref:Amino acid transporter transmembrane domain-containing protein n=1 Tax=Oryza nivara TaxID=4536 RepID=A0A0E0GGP4_ORYNI
MREWRRQALDGGQLHRLLTDDDQAFEQEDGDWVIGSGVLALAWSVAQLGWVAGPLALAGFACVTYYTSTLLANAYRAPHPVTGTRDRTYMDAVRSYLSPREVFRVHVRNLPVRQPVGHHGRLHNHRNHKHGVSNRTDHPNSAVFLL